MESNIKRTGHEEGLDDAAVGKQRRADTPQSGGQASRPFVTRGPDRRASGKAQQSNALIASGRITAASLSAALLGALGFWLLGLLSIAVSGGNTPALGLWLPGAIAVVLLLRGRLSNEWPLLAGFVAAAFMLHHNSGHAATPALILALASMAEVAIVTALVRLTCGAQPDMQRLGDLAKVVAAGGMIAPALSALITAFVIEQATAWFLYSSIAMVLIVPTGLLLLDPIRKPPVMNTKKWLELVAALTVGIVCTAILFGQSQLPLLFLIPPITLFHAFRLGSLGTALHVLAVASVAIVMTLGGSGPIAAATPSAVDQLMVLQLFAAANVLTGLPVAAILVARNSALAELAQGKRQIEILTENISDAVLHYDASGICTFASPSAQNVTGLLLVSLLGQHVCARLHPDARENIEAAFNRLYGGVSEKERLTYRRLQDSREGVPVYLEADCALVRDPQDASLQGMVVALRDVTERVELEVLLTKARQQAEQAAEAKSDFLANMSHEIRTPMNGVLGFAEMMLQDELAPHHRRYAEMIVQSGRSMMMLLNDILDLSKIEAGQFAVDLAPLDLHATLAECVALHRPAADQKGLSISLEPADKAVPDELKPWIISDGLRLRQIVLNLLANAVKFTAKGHVRLHYTIEDGVLRVSVTDSGIGIEPARLEVIFAPFSQGDKDIAQTYGGTGLGLSISRRLAALLGGDIEVESTMGTGSRFTLTIPAKHARPQELDRAENTLPPEPPALPEGSRVLLAEDHDVNRLLIGEMLERCDIAVAMAHDGHEAISMVIDSLLRGRPFDLALMDVQMPVCDGYTATRAIRAEGIGPDLLPIIALSANAFPDDIAASRSAGMQAHLAKPVEFSRLVRLLQRWLPTRIVEAASVGAPTTQHAFSPRLQRHWIKRRTQAIAALQAWLRDRDSPGHDDGALATMMHKLAGTAALFGEAELGHKAAALEQAIRSTQEQEVRAALVEELLALALADTAEST